MESIETLFVWGEFPPTDLTVSEHNQYVLVRDAANKIRYGLEQRDQALIHGAVGATTLVRSGGAWFLPGTGEEVSLDSELDANDGDVFLIGTGNDAFSAALGAYSAAIQLVS